MPAHLRAQAADSIHFEAQRRLEDPIYGCVKIIYELHHQIRNTETQLAKTRAEIAFMINSTNNITQETHHDHNYDQLQLLDLEFNLENFSQEQSNIIEQSPFGASTQHAPWSI